MYRDQRIQCRCLDLRSDLLTVSEVTFTTATNAFDLSRSPKVLKRGLPYCVCGVLS